MGFIAFYASAIVAFMLVDRLTSRRAKHLSLTRVCPPPQISQADIVIHGKDLGITDEELERILLKRFPYYSPLALSLKALFLLRLKKFLSKKTFIIKDDEGFREMPVLTSAAAIQLTFGLKQYLLPFYPFIRIYPQEYFSEQSFKVLAGNVQGNIITVAWNHLLQGITNPADGANVGLHEMSHALYIQKLVVEEGFTRRFTREYNHLLSECRTAFDDETMGRVDLYTEYATTNMDEFWAGSVELFFEKPSALNHNYPLIYKRMMTLLNQDPLKPHHPLLKNSRAFSAFSFLQR
jgi:Mlc titration factor MtfA (ptsG expression regulator)